MSHERPDLSPLVEAITQQVTENLEAFIGRRKDAGMKTWVYQPWKARQKHGDNAPWYVGWLDTDGKRRTKACGKGDDGKKAAEKLAAKIHAELITGTYASPSGITWKSFRVQYEGTILTGKSKATQKQARFALDGFERLVHPVKMRTIRTSMIDEFIAKRRLEKGRWTKTQLSPASVNADLRCLKAALRVAKDWRYLPEVPKFRMVREIERDPTNVPFEDFDKMLAHCHVAKTPYLDAERFWQCFLAVAYTTGWRVSELLAIRRDGIDFEKEEMLLKGEFTKGRRDAVVDLQPVTLAALKEMQGFTERVFEWHWDHKALYREFHRIQEAAGVKCKAKGKFYGFHDLRRGAINNFKQYLTPDQTKHLARHKSLQTTMKHYCNPRHQLKEAIGRLPVPESLRRKYGTQG